MTGPSDSRRRPPARELQAAGRTRRHSALRDAFVASASAGVVVLLVLFVFAAPSARLDADIGPVVPRPGAQAVVEGRVLAADGSGLEGAEVAVHRVGGTMRTARSSAAGTFRLPLAGSCSTYTVSVRAESNGENVETARRARLCPGDSLPVDARIVTQGHFLWVPGPR
jgi:hypothetical protein